MDEVDEVMELLNASGRRRLSASITPRAAAIKTLVDKYESLLPRWQAAVLTAQAELETQGVDELPWANMKFSFSTDKSKTLGSTKYRDWESLDIAVGQPMFNYNLARYKYHIDLGGGGGTTWSGTVEKLAMPGLLFHHVTPTKDYIHDELVPWRHYIPVSTDLRDLKSKVDWAESHPDEARGIAESATQFMRHLGTPKGYEALLQKKFVEPIRRVIEAYKPVALTHPGMSWKKVLESLDDYDTIPVVECSGDGGRPERACRMLVEDDAVSSWRKY